ncbi:MAG: cache domain-containing protein [Candidatus Omnitrophota bacterium]
MTTKRFRKFARLLWPIKIWQQIFLILVPLICIPLVLLGLLLIHTSQMTIHKVMYASGETIAVRAASEINEFIKKPVELLMVTSAMFGIFDKDAWRQETVLVELSLAYPMFQHLAFVNMNGHETATSELGEALKDVSKQTAFLLARTGETYMSELKITDEDPVPVMTIAVPVHYLGRIQGVLIADVNIRGFWDIVDRIRLGETGQAFVINQYGSFLSHPDKKRILEYKQLTEGALLRSVSEGRSGVYQTMSRENHWLEFYAPIKETGWGLVIFQDQKEAYQTSRMMKTQSIILIIVSVLTALGISLFLAPVISRPVNLLIGGIRRIAKGDFNHPLEVKRADEMGLLLNSFNKMMRKFKRAQRAEKLAVIGKAAAAMVHELKNSVVLVNTYIQLLAERYHDKKFVLEFSRIVPQELNAWKGMLQNVIDFSKPNEFPMMEVDVNALMKDLAILAEARVRQNGAHLVLDIGEDLPLIEGNAEKLKQVLLNLLSNAIEAIGSEGTITVKTKSFPGMRKNEKPGVIIEVHNTGEWILPEKTWQLFEPFYSTKTDGLGLGLAVSREIIRRHGGTIDVKSAPGEGVFFIVRIPIKKDDGRNV